VLVLMVMEVDSRGVVRMLLSLLTLMSCSIPGAIPPLHHLRLYYCHVDAVVLPRGNYARPHSSSYPPDVLVQLNADVLIVNSSMNFAIYPKPAIHLLPEVNHLIRSLPRLMHWVVHRWCCCLMVGLERRRM